MHSSSFVPSICRALVVLVLVAGPEIFAKPKDKSKVIKDDLVVTGDATIDGTMAITGDIDVAGSSSTLGSYADTYGLGTFYMDSGVDGVRWRLNREAGWVWEMEISGSVNPAMRLDESSRLFLYANGVPGAVIDPAGQSLSLGDVSLFRTSGGVLKTNATLRAANLSGINTGDQTRADLNLGKRDTVKFGRVKVGGAEASERVFVADDNETDGKDFVILADGTHQWREGKDQNANLYRIAPGTLRTDGAFIIGGAMDSDASTTDALTVEGGAGVAGDLNVGGEITAMGLRSTGLTLSAGGESAEMFPTIHFGSDPSTQLAGVTAMPTEDAPGEGVLTLSTRPAAGDLTEQVRITGDGQVGIGTADPEYRLDVAGEMRVAGTGHSIFKGPVLLTPQGDLSMGEFTAGPNPNDF